MTITEEDASIVQTLHSNGLSKRKISVITGICRGTVSNILKGTHVPKKRDYSKQRLTVVDNPLSHCNSIPQTNSAGGIDYIHTSEYRCPSCGGMIKLVPCPGCYMTKLNEQRVEKLKELQANAKKEKE